MDVNASLATGLKMHVHCCPPFWISEIPILEKIIKMGSLTHKRYFSVKKIGAEHHLLNILLLKIQEKK